MKLLNREIFEINLALNEIIENKMSAKLAFKLYKIKKKIEDEVILIKKSLQGKEEEEEEIDQVLAMENEIDIEKIRASELEEIKLSVNDVFLLEKIIDFEEGEENE